MCQQYARDVDEVDLSIASDFFRLVSSNFKALNLCGLRLGDLLPDEKEQKALIKAYERCSSIFDYKAE